MVMVAIRSVHSQVLGFHVLRQRNMIVDESFLRTLIKISCERTIFG